MEHITPGYAPEDLKGIDRPSMNRPIITNKNMQELNPQGSYAFPYNFLYISIRDYPGENFPFHWHSEVELEYILEGEMTYQINDKSFVAKENDCIFINKNTLHSGMAYNGQDCKYVCIVFHPSLVYGFENSILDTNFAAPMLSNLNFDHVVFSDSFPDHARMQIYVQELMRYNDGEDVCRELHITSVLCEIWSLLFKRYSQFLQVNQNSPAHANEKKLRDLKNALTFIYENYASPITLDEMAESCHLSKSRFCRIFKETFHQTPFDFLLNHRIQMSLPLLLDKNLSITEVATSVGFSAPSYYSEIFRKYMLCSPSTYRKNIEQEKNDQEK